MERALVPQPHGGALQHGNTKGVGRTPGFDQKLREACARDLDRKRTILVAIIDAFAEYLKDHRAYLKEIRDGKADFVEEALGRVRRLASVGIEVKQADWDALERALTAAPRGPIALVSARDAIAAIGALYEMSGMKVTLLAVNPQLPGMEDPELDEAARLALLKEVGIG